MKKENVFLKKKVYLITIAIIVVVIFVISFGMNQAPKAENSSKMDKITSFEPKNNPMEKPGDPSLNDLSTEAPSFSENSNIEENINKTSPPVQDIKEGRSFQSSTDTDFSKVDPNMPKNILDKIKTTYESAKERLTDDPYAFGPNMEKAGALYSVREYEKAVIIYKKLGELKPENFISFRALGGAYVALKKYPEAEQAYLVAIKNDLTELQSYMALADIYTNSLKGDKDKIQKFYEDGIRNLGSNGYSLIKSYATYLESIGEYTKSIDQWRIVSKEFPDDQAVKEKITELENKL